MYIKEIITTNVGVIAVSSDHRTALMMRNPDTGDHFWQQLPWKLPDGAEVTSGGTCSEVSNVIYLEDKRNGR